tara:strand:- start:8147 stop:8413 length:267 start_codon:yes stop_codon:yes gene_type:complete
MATAPAKTGCPGAAAATIVGVGATSVGIGSAVGVTVAVSVPTAAVFVTIGGLEIGVGMAEDAGAAQLAKRAKRTGHEYDSRHMSFHGA